MLWAKHPKARFKPVIIGSAICTLIENAPINWGVRLTALDFYQLDDSSWFFYSHLTESQFISIDVDIVLYLISTRELSNYISMIFDETNTIEVLSRQTNLGLLAKKFVADDLHFCTGNSFTPGQLETLLQQVRLGISGGYTSDVVQAIDYVVRRIPNHNAELSTEAKRKQDCIRLYTEKSQQPHRPKYAVDHRFHATLTSASREHFGNRNRVFSLRTNFDDTHTLKLSEGEGQRARYPEVMTKIYGELTDAKIEYAIATLIKIINAQKFQVEAINRFIVGRGDGQFPMLALMADVSNDSNDASHSDISEVIESVSAIDLSRMFFGITTVPLHNIGADLKSVVFIRSGNSPNKSGESHVGITWRPALAIHHDSRTENLNLEKIVSRLGAGTIISVDEALSDKHINMHDVKRVDRLTDLFNRASDYRIYSSLTLNLIPSWGGILSPDSNSWVARFLLRHIAAGNEYLVLIYRASSQLECHDLPPTIPLFRGERSQILELEVWFDVGENDHLTVLTEEHLLFPRSIPESKRLKYISYDELREIGWRPKVSVLYKEVERYYRQQISAESVEILLWQYELEFLFLEILSAAGVKAHDILRQILTVISAYVLKNPNEISFFGVDSKSILSVSGKMKIDSYLKYIDWPALCGDRAG